MKNLIIVSLFGELSTDSSRLGSIYEYSCDFVLKVITADFDHRKKTYKDPQDEIEYIHVPSYTQNLSFLRIYSHVVFAYRLNKILNRLVQRPSVIYCAMPSSLSAYVCGIYCKKHHIKFVIDVIDLWPDSLIPIIGGFRSKLLNVFLYPWKQITIKAYKQADIILGESKKYAEIAHHFNPEAQVHPFYLGVDMPRVSSLIQQSKLVIRKPESELWICYSGNLGKSYDFKTMIKSISILNGICVYKLLLVGDGVCRNEIENLIDEYSVNAEITGFVSYGDLLKYLSYCDIAINIFRTNTKVVHSYKFNDYVATDCFILNSLLGETADMVNEYQIGLNFDFEDNHLEKVLMDCVNKWEIYRHWKINNRKLITEVLCKKRIYSELTKILIS